MPPPPPTSSLESGQSPRGLLRPGRRLRSGTHQCFHRDHPRFGFASHPAKRRDDVKQVLRRHAIPSGRLHADCGQQRNLAPPARRRRAVELTQVTARSEEHTSELQSLMRISYAVFCLKKKTNKLTVHIFPVRENTS